MAGKVLVMMLFSFDKKNKTNLKGLCVNSVLSLFSSIFFYKLVTFDSACAVLYGNNILIFTGLEIIFGKIIEVIRL